MSIMFTVGDKPGALTDVLRLFDKHKVNLTSIESRPSKGVCVLGEFLRRSPQNSTCLTISFAETTTTTCTSRLKGSYQTPMSVSFLPTPVFGGFHDD